MPTATRPNVENHSDRDRMILASRERQQAIDDWFSAAAEFQRSYQDWVTTGLRLLLPQMVHHNF